MRITLFSLISLAIAAIFGACNQHSWEEGKDGNPPTKELFKPHGGHGDDHDGDHKGHEKDHDGDEGHKDGDEDGGEEKKEGAAE